MRLVYPGVDERPVRPGRLSACDAEPALHSVERQEGRTSSQPSRGSMAGPGPLLRRRAQSRADGISHDVSECLHLARLVAHDPRPIPPLEQMPLALMGGVELLDVPPIDSMHRLTQVRQRRLDEQVVMVAHQTVGVADETISHACPLDQAKKSCPIFIAQV